MKRTESTTKELLRPLVSHIHPIKIQSHLWGTLLALLVRGNRALLLTLFPFKMLNLRGNCFYLYITQRRRIAFNLWLFFLKQPAVFQMTNSRHLYICLFISFFGILCFVEAITKKLLYPISFSVWIWLVSHIWGPYQILHFVDSTSWAIVYMHLPRLEFFLLGLIELRHIELNQLP
jgi:hypothetical protein